MDLTLKATRDAFGDTILDLAEKDSKIVSLTADLADSLRLIKFKERFPNRFFDMGVAEQNMLGTAAGLALSGFIPYVASFAVFNPGRNWDQLRVSVAYNNANVKVIGGYVGFSNGKDGATHQALEDIAITRVLPNLVVIDTCDYNQTKEAIIKINDYKGPVYLRIRRDPIQNIEVLLENVKQKKLSGYDTFIPYEEIKNKFEIGKADILKNGTDITLIACGQMVQKAIDASIKLEEEKISTKIINLSTIKPIDRMKILSAAQETGCIVTVEEHQYMGGMGSAVAEVLIQDYPVPQKIIGVNNIFGETGTQQELLDSRDLTVENIVWNAKEVLKLKKLR